MIQHRYILEEDGTLPAGAHNGKFVKVDGDFVVIECDCDENKDDSGYQADELLGNSTLEKLAAKTLGSIKSARKAKSSAANGKLGGRPKSKDKGAN